MLVLARQKTRQKTLTQLAMGKTIREAGASRSSSWPSSHSRSGAGHPQKRIQNRSNFAAGIYEVVSRPSCKNKPASAHASDGAGAPPACGSSSNALVESKQMERRQALGAFAGHRQQNPVKALPATTRQPSEGLRCIDCSDCNIVSLRLAAATASTTPGSSKGADLVLSELDSLFEGLEVRPPPRPPPIRRIYASRSGRPSGVLEMFATSFGADAGGDSYLSEALLPPSA